MPAERSVNNTFLLTIPAGTSKIFYPPTRNYATTTNPQAHMLLGVTPGAGGTLTLEVQITPGGAWRPITSGQLAGAVAVALMDIMLFTPHALRFTAAVAAAIVEIAL